MTVSASGSMPPSSVDEAVRRQFERAWMENCPQPIEHFVPAASASSNLPTLEELVHIELEMKWKSWQPGASPPVLVEWHLERFPALRQPDILLRLLEQEWLVRRRQGDQATAEDYRRRFPEVTGLEAPSPLGASQTVPSSTDTVGPWPHVPGYEILDELGRGGMGIVYLARQLKLKRLVALKMIRAGVHADHDERKRFLTEAEAVARLQHPNIVQIYDVGEWRGGEGSPPLPYFALEFVNGCSLAQQLAGQPCSPRVAARLTEILARAMQAAHERSIVHRDLKPANILLQIDECRLQDEKLHHRPIQQSAICNLQSAVPKITDFGLAKQLDDDSGQTQTGAVLGTPCYMAPEQAAGHTKSIGPAADVYALGAILYELLTGQPPFRGATVVQTLELVRTQEPVPPARLQSKVPRDLETICLKCLAKEPDRRYGSMLLLAQDLERFQAGEAILACREGPARRLWRTAQRHRKAVVAGALVTLALAVIGLIAAQAVHRSQQRAELSQRIADNRNLEHFEEVIAWIHQLEHLGQEDADDRRQDFCDRYAKFLSARIRQLALTDEEILRIGNAITALEREAPELAQARRQELAQRLASWQTVFMVPGSVRPNWDEVFDPTIVGLQADGLVRRRAVSGQEAPVRNVMTRVPCQGDVELEVTFAPGWEAAPELGLLLNANLGHAQPITALAFAPDGRTIVSASGSAKEVGKLKLWDLATGRERASYQPDQPGALSVGFGPSLVVSCSGSAEVSVLDPATGEVRHRWPAHAQGVSALAWSADGTTLATASVQLEQPKGEIKLWQAGSWKLLTTLTGHTAAVGRLAFSPDNHWLASSSQDRTVIVWDLAKQQPRLTSVPLDLRSVPWARFTPDSRYLIAAAHTDAAQRGKPLASMLLWDCASGQEQYIAAAGDLAALAIAPDGKQFASSGAGILYLEDLPPARRTILARVGVLTAAEFAPDGKLLVTGGQDGQVHLWNVADRCAEGLLGDSRYEFALRPMTGQVALRQARNAGAPFALQISRDGIVLRQISVSSALLDPTAPLCLRSRRLQDRLEFQVGALAPLEFQDILPLPRQDQGNYGLRWPSGVALRSVQARRQAMPQQPSLLEQGDYLYARGRYAEAMAHYQQVAVQEGKTVAGQEARLKSAFCLLDLRRPMEAAEQFERVAAEEGGVWPLIAACQVLLIRINQGKTAEADTAFELLSARHRRADFAAVVPQRFRERLVLAHLGSLFIIPNLVRPQPELLRNLQQAQAVQELFRMTAAERFAVAPALLRAFHLAGDTDQALKLAGEMMDLDPAYWQNSLAELEYVARPGQARLGACRDVVEHYCWLLRERGQSREALQRLDRLLFIEPGVCRPNFGFLLPERARLHAALEEWSEAEQDLQQFFQLLPSGSQWYATDAAAWLTLGFLLERRGQADAARQAWREGTYRSWQQRRSLSTVEAKAAGLGELVGIDSLLGLIVAALADELTDQDAEAFLTQATATVGPDSPLTLVKNRLPFRPAVLRTMWRTPRGKDCAVRIAFHRGPYAEYLHLPLVLLAAEICREGAFADKFSGEQDELVWKLTSDLHAAFAAGKLGTTQMLALVLTWKGTSGLLGWGGLAPTLPPELRGPLAYVAGHRFRRLNQPAEAASFFQAALRDAKPDSLLHRLTQAELNRQR